LIGLLIRAPAYPQAGCAGVLFLLLLAAPACRERGPSNQQVVLELESDTIQLPAGVQLHQIRMRVSQPSEFDPPSVQARAGDVVRFEADDGHNHAILFDAPQLSQQMHDFLERSGQLGGPPLLDRGASWIVSFEGAPPGTYGFRCLTHGASGTITLTP
jgi:plastocyanin